MLVIELLLEYSADQNLKNNLGYTPLELCHPDIYDRVKEIFDSYANLEVKDPGYD